MWTQLRDSQLKVLFIFVKIMYLKRFELVIYGSLRSIISCHSFCIAIDSTSYRKMCMLSWLWASDGLFYYWVFIAQNGAFLTDPGLQMTTFPRYMHPWVCNYSCSENVFFLWTLVVFILDLWDTHLCWLRQTRYTTKDV